MNLLPTAANLSFAEVMGSNEFLCTAWPEPWPGQSLGLGDHVDVVFRPALPASIAKIPEGLLAKQRGVGRNNFSPM